MKTLEPLRAFHNDPKVKAKYLDRVRKHREADQLIQGYGYWQDGKGCAVGCTIHSSNHFDYPRLLGIPTVLAYLQDRIFERSSQEFARLWPERFLTAAKEGADLTMVWPRFAVWLLLDEKEGIVTFAKSRAVKDSVKLVGNLYERWVAGDEPSETEWSSARDKIYAAALAALDVREKFFASAGEKLLELMSAAPVPKA